MWTVCLAGAREASGGSGEGCHPGGAASNYHARGEQCVSMCRVFMCVCVSMCVVDGK